MSLQPVSQVRLVQPPKGCQHECRQDDEDACQRILAKQRSPPDVGPVADRMPTQDARGDSEHGEHDSGSDQSFDTSPPPLCVPARSGGCRACGSHLEGGVLMQAVIAIPETIFMSGKRRAAGQLLQKICGIPLLIRTAGTPAAAPHTSAPTTASEVFSATDSTTARAMPSASSA